MADSTSRRDFLKTASFGAAALSMTASSYARIVGANERIAIGMIGCGGRGQRAHMSGVHPHDKTQNAEFTAVCDPWRKRREEASALAKEWYGRPARQFVSYRDVLALDDIDAVMIASCDHQHTTHLEAAAKAQLDRGYRMTELLKQGLYRPMHVTDQIFSIYAGTRGHLDKIPAKEVHAWEEGFLAFIHENKQPLWQKITDSHKLDDESLAEMDRAIAEYQGQYAGKKETARA